jgi:TolB-like protein/Tfp pilus assembly protein PilF
MPPEPLQGEPVDARADIYTIGAVLYEMATDIRAFPDELPSRVIDAILHHPPVPPRALNSRISPELERIILKCLDKDPGRRFQSAKELLVDLGRLGTPSTAHTSALPLPPHFWKRAARLTAYAGFGLLALAVVLGALNIGGWRDRLRGLSRPSQIRSLAVLPLENRSGDPEQDFFADGMTDELISELAKISGIKVISRTSVMRFKNSKQLLPQIAKSLKVDAVVEGSVQRVGDRVRIKASLVYAGTDRELWTRSYDEDLRDVLTLESVVAKAIADEIQVQLTPLEQARLSRPRPENPQAHEAYLMGRYYWNKRTADGLLKSIAYLEQAIAKDPDYAIAYAALADSYHVLPELTSVTAAEAFPKARTAALKALELDNSLAEAHTALASIKEDYDWDWKGAEASYERGIELSPGYMLAHAWYSNLLLELGRYPEALAQARIAQQLDPLSVLANDNLSAILFYAGENDQSIDQCRKTLEIDPTSSQAHRHLAQAYTQKQLYSEAIAELKKAIELSNGSPAARSELGYVFGISGNTEEARRILLQLKSGADVSPYHLAIVYMGLKESDKALEALNEAVKRRSAGVVHLKIARQFQDLRKDQRFERMLIDVGLESAAGKESSG